MVNTRSSCRTQRAHSMAADTKRQRGDLFISPEYANAHPMPPPPLASPAASASASSSQPTAPPVPRFDPASSSFFDFNQFQRSAPTPVPDQKKESKIAQRQRREQIVLRLQQQQIDAQEKARQEKLEKQQAKLERKQRRSESKGRATTGQFSPLPTAGFSDGQTSPYLTDSQLYANRHYYDDHDRLSTSSSSTASHNIHNDHDRMRSLSLKSNTKSMYDLRPWSGEPQSSSRQHHVGYESDENTATYQGWDSLMETLQSPSMSVPSDTVSWDGRDDHDWDVVEPMNTLSLSNDDYDDEDDTGNGNGRYLLVLGANGRTGLELVRQGLERNYRVTAFVRDDKAFLEDSSLRKNHNLIIVRGSPTSQADVDRCVENQDVVVNVIGARLMANDTTIGSHSQVVLNNALKKHGVRRLIVVTSYGCLGLRNYLINTKRLFSRVFMTGILKDKVLQEDIIQRESEYLDWTIVRPITLKDGDLSQRYYVSTDELPKANKVKILTRKDLAHYILAIISRPSDFCAIRSIAGQPRQTRLVPSGVLEKRRETQEPYRSQHHQQLQSKTMQDRRTS